MTLVGDENGLAYLEMNNDECKYDFHLDKSWVRNDIFFKDVMQQIREYCLGKRISFNVKLNPKGTVFQQKVWAALLKIPYGALRSYKDIAIAVGNEKASRAVGMANSRNPIALIIPCHRVIGATGKLTGYAHGLTLKREIIEFERSNVL